MLDYGVADSTIKQVGVIGVGVMALAIAAGDPVGYLRILPREVQSFIWVKH